MAHHVLLHCFKQYIAGFSNLNQPRATHLSAAWSKIRGVLIDFPKNFDYYTHHISNYSGLIEPKIVIQYFLVSLFH